MRKSLIILIIVSLALLGGVFLWATNRDKANPPTSSTNDSDLSPEVSPEGSKVNPDGTPVGGTKTDEPAAPKPVPPASEVRENVVVTLSRATVTKDMVTITGYAETTKEGRCTLTLSQSGQKTLSYNTPAELEVSNVSCNPFRIPRGDFPKSGDWKAVIEFSASGLSGTSNEWVLSL